MAVVFSLLALRGRRAVLHSHADQPPLPQAQARARLLLPSSDTDTWRHARGRYLNAGRTRKTDRLPARSLLATFVSWSASIFTPCVLAWHDLHHGVRRAPRWYRATNAHNWLLHLILLPVLPFVVSGLQRLEARLAREAISGGLVASCGATSRARHLVRSRSSTAPFFLVRGAAGATVAVPVADVAVAADAFAAAPGSIVRAKGTVRRGRAARIAPRRRPSSPPSTWSLRYLHRRGPRRSAGKLLLAADHPPSLSSCFRLAGPGPVLHPDPTGLVARPAPPMSSLRAAG